MDGYFQKREEMARSARGTDERWKMEVRNTTGEFSSRKGVFKSKRGQGVDSNRGKMNISSELY